MVVAVIMTALMARAMSLLRLVLMVAVFAHDPLDCYFAVAPQLCASTVIFG
jgi:hypothetical protein